MNERINRTWKLAGITVGAEFTYPYLASQCQTYETDEAPALFITVTAEDIEFERAKCNDGIVYSKGYLESLAFYRKFTVAALNYAGLLMHGSAICYRGRGYIYTAPSGTGKSTHARLCKEVFGEEVSYINDDKPILRLEDGVWYVYGTPWDGKHGLNENVRVPLGGICKLERGKTNSINKITYDDALSVLMSQIYRPNDAVNMKRTLDLLLLLGKTPFYLLKCNISGEAARLSLGTMGLIYEAEKGSDNVGNRRQIYRGGG